MPRSRGLTIYVGAHVAVTLAALAFAAVTILEGADPNFGFPAHILATLIAHFQSQFLAAWIVLGSTRAAARLLIGAGAMLLVFAESLLTGIAGHGWLWFSLKVAALMTLLPPVVIAVGLAPELFGTRRIRFVAHELRRPGPPPQFSIRMLFGCLLLTAALATAAQFFPIDVVSGDEEPLFAPTGLAFAMSVGFSFSAVFLAIALTCAVATFLLLTSRVWWLLPAPLLAAFLGGVVAVSAETVQVIGSAGPLSPSAPAPRSEVVQIGLFCAVASLLPMAHFLILRACGYRLVTAERSPPRDR